MELLTLIPDDRRIIIIPGDYNETIFFCAERFIHLAQQAIQDRGHFFVALSGGNTPLAIFELLAKHFSQSLDWSKVFWFWSDERQVPPDHPESNYGNAIKSGLSQLNINFDRVFRMHAETSIEHNAQAYENLIKATVPFYSFDLVMLGVGEDGHTASLFPHTPELQEAKKLVVAAKNATRMTFTYPCIHLAKNIYIYALGTSKAKIVERVFKSPYNNESFPIQKVGTTDNKAIWILDKASGRSFMKLS